MNPLADKVYKYSIDQGLLKEGMGVIAGVSGGADSVCLLRILKEIEPVLKLKLYAVHIEHGIRGAESRADMDFVKELCKGLNVPLNVYEEDVPVRAAELKMTVEEAGRHIRYEAFNKEAKLQNADAIAVAHHMGDQAETVLFNMIRGSGLKGISAMAPRRGNIIRPLLNVSREEIEAYLNDIGQGYRTDSTNKDTGYSRNGIRNLIVPELESIVSGAVKHIAAAADEVREADDYIRQEAGRVRDKAVSVTAPEENVPGVYDIDIGSISKEPPVIGRYVVRSVITDIYLSHKDLEALHVNEVLKLTEGQSGRSVTLPRGITARRDGDHILIGRTEDVSSHEGKLCVKLDTEGKTVIPGGVFTACIEPYDKEQIIPDGLYTKWFDYDKIVDGVFVRNRRSGDHLVIDDKGHDKKLKNYLIDEKVPALKRDELILLADGSHIMWIPGMRISSHYKITHDTKRVLKIEFKGENNGQ
ncbi:MAG: tRNA lysidine(34) synthetase TilS [Lachnospiraceae bacterium]|nr:tRNA lysidine(34) synthetase TilS [Lachnospiraceae bacterium]